MSLILPCHSDPFKTAMNELYPSEPHILAPTNIVSLKRNSCKWPTKLGESYSTIDLRTMLVDAEVENIRVRLPTQGSGVSPLQGPGTPGTRDPRAIRHRQSCSRVQNVRTPPPGLWRIKNLGGVPMDISSVPDGVCTTVPQVEPLEPGRPQPTAYQHQPRSGEIADSSFGGRGRSKGIDDSTTRVSKESTWSPTRRAYLETTTSQPPPVSFPTLLTENKKRHAHAPSMVSMMNPLRDLIPSRAWTLRNIPLTSERFRTPISRQNRDRMICDWESVRARQSVALYLQKTLTHCRGCKEDTVLKKLLVLGYLRQRLLLSVLALQPAPMQDEYAMDIDDQGYPSCEDEDLLESPILRDLDDFDDFDDLEILEDEDDLLLSDVKSPEMADLRLF